MLVPSLTLYQPPGQRILRLREATGDYHATLNPGGFGGINPSRSQVEASLSIVRASDNSVALSERPLPTDLFTAGNDILLPINLPDATYTLIMRVYSNFGVPHTLSSYELVLAYLAGAHLWVKQNGLWVDVTGAGIVDAGQIRWVAALTPDVYSEWKLVNDTGSSVFASGNLLAATSVLSSVLNGGGIHPPLVGYTAIRLIADSDLRAKIGTIAQALTGSDFPRASDQLLAAWGKLYFDYEAVRLDTDTVPYLLDAKLAALHRMADRLR